MDFVRDLEEMARFSLKEKKYSEEDLSKFSDNLLLAYFKDEQLSITAKTRRVVYSNQFTCPEDYKEALKEFVNKVEKGEDLSPFMSTSVRRYRKNNDDLLNDWGIHHFHLTNEFQENGIAKRSNYLLFTCCDENTMYFVQVYPHQTENFSRKELLVLIKDNWPHLLRKLDEGKLCEEISDEDRYEIRRSHCMIPTEIDGGIYFPRGGGYASDGSSINAVIKYNSCLAQILRLERIFQDNYSAIMDFVQSCLGMKISRHWQLKLIEMNTPFFVILELTNHIIMRAQLENNSLKFSKIILVTPHSDV